MSQVLGKALKRCIKHSPVLVLKKGSVECKSWVVDKAKGAGPGILESELIA